MCYSIYTSTQNPEYNAGFNDSAKNKYICKLADFKCIISALLPYVSYHDIMYAYELTLMSGGGEDTGGSYQVIEHCPR